MNEPERRNYQILNTIATGGTAVLYKAIQTSLDRPVVIKRLHAHLTSDPNFTRRFELEAKAAASLDHENIVRIIDFGSTNDNYYIVMEYIDGPSLKDVLSSRPVLGEELALLIAHEICMGLEHAHEHGIVHRDVKPANIMITNDGQVKITDFGLAKLHQSQTQQTVASTLLGTPLYMSPEQAIGESVDQRSDLFSLGTICYEAMTGTQPFLGENYAAVIQSIINGNLPPPSRLRKEIGPQAEAIVMKALSREPSKRFRTAGEMARAIEAHLGQERIIAMRDRLKRLASGDETAPPQAAGPKARRASRHAVPAALAVIAIGAALAVGILPGPSARVRSWIEALRTAHPAAPSIEIMTAGQGEAAPGLVMTPLEESETNEVSAAAPAKEKPPAETPAVDSVRSSAPDPEQASAPVPEKPADQTPPVPPPMTAPASSESREPQEPAEESGFVQISVDPPSEIVIDGRIRAVGEDLGSLELIAGPHEVVCRHEGYKDYTETIMIKRGELSRRSIALEEIMGCISVETPRGAQMFVDGDFKGTTPLGAPLSISPGTHEIELKKIGFRHWRNTVYVPPNETLRLNIGLVPL